MSISVNKGTLTIGIGAVITAVIALVGTGWRAGTEAAAIRAEITELRRDLRASVVDRWSVGDMERWTYQLDRHNRDRGLVVPDVRTVKADRGQ